ncbi:uncharacterized protein LOC134777242 [Penaeus indicus]|uniref:uncharacterized protein LOC134777242 n=1 Tax=Penaeus indicus TaxID=29960 RepID=UPI00300CDB6F
MAVVVLFHQNQCLFTEQSVGLSPKKEESLLRRTEMRKLRHILQVSLKDEIRNGVIRSRCGTTDIVEKVQEARLRWLGHVLRREDEEPCRMAWKLSLEGDRGRGKPRQRGSDNIKKDLEEKGLAERDISVRVEEMTPTPFNAALNCSRVSPLVYLSDLPPVRDFHLCAKRVD